MLSMSIPLAERLRPRTLDEYIGQAHLVGQNGVFRKFLETGNVPSFILWGPPGVGKTTLAKIVATTLKRPFYTLSAVTSGVKEVREVLESARKQKFFDSKPPILFIDEIHRFNKSQQDSLLGAVEQGVVTLIGATTENPSFEVISPLLSRCQVYILQPMTDGELQTLLDRALATDPELKTREIEVHGNRSAVPLFGRRRPQAAQHSGHHHGRRRRQSNDHQPIRHRLVCSRTTPSTTRTANSTTT